MAFFPHKALIIIGPFESLPARTWWFTGKREQIERTGIDLTLRPHMIPCKDRLDSRWDVSKTAGCQTSPGAVNGTVNDRGLNSGTMVATDCWWFYPIQLLCAAISCYFKFYTSHHSCPVWERVGLFFQVQSAARRVNTAVKESESHTPKIQLFESALRYTTDTLWSTVDVHLRTTPDINQTICLWAKDASCGDDTLWIPLAFFQRRQKIHPPNLPIGQS